MTEGTVRETPDGVDGARGFRPAGGDRAESMGFVPGHVAPLVAGRTGLTRRAGRGMREYLGALTTLVILVVVLGSTESGFFAVGNVQNVLETNAP
ncbi:MAG: hypothetical protein M0010_05030, partial [Actinomycetota bacterium]|nr:hypothetical protein [Actinomycetota bacterium]